MIMPIPNLTKSEKELIIDILSFELDTELDLDQIKIAIWNLLDFELESMEDYPDATPFYKNKNQIKKILEKLDY